MISFLMPFGQSHGCFGGINYSTSTPETDQKPHLCGGHAFLHDLRRDRGWSGLFGCLDAGGNHAFHLLQEGVPWKLRWQWEKQPSTMNEDVKIVYKKWWFASMPG